MSLLKLFRLNRTKASQNLIVTAKAHAAFNGKFSPDEELKPSLKSGGREGITDK
jgi:hypothetical protein